jgi:Pyruvate/2-oxoacid:ferredoxin oxidoreductase gamma subunit
VARVSTYAKDLVDTLQAAIDFEGFSLVDIWGICPGRYTRRNKLTPKTIEEALEKLPDVGAYTSRNLRKEYGRAYREEAARLKPVAEPPGIEPEFEPPVGGRQEVVLLGSAGQRIITAGEILCLAGTTAGLHATQKNDYPITVMRGHSVSELILSDSEIDYTGIEQPATVIALAAEGVARRKMLWGQLSEHARVLSAAGLDLPETAAAVESVDFKARHIKSSDWALAALGLLARRNRVLSLEMLKAALALRFKGRVLEQALALVDRVGD